MLFGVIALKIIFWDFQIGVHCIYIIYSLLSPPTLPVSPDPTPSGIPNLSSCCARVHAHVHMRLLPPTTLLSPFNVAFIYMCLALTIWN